MMKHMCVTGQNSPWHFLVFPDAHRIDLESEISPVSAKEEKKKCLRLFRGPAPASPNHRHKSKERPIALFPVMQLPGMAAVLAPSYDLNVRNVAGIRQ